MILVALALSLSVALVESVTYLGSFRAHVAVPAIFVYLFTIATFFIPLKLSNLTRKILNLSLWILAATTGVLYVVLSIFESFRYPNFVFSTTHINLAGLEIFLLLMIIFYFQSLSLGQGSKQKLASGILSGFVAVAVLSFADLLPLIVKSVAPIISLPLATYDQKMTGAYPGFYPAMMQVKSLTKGTSTIHIPPQGAPWVLEGNVALVSRFLYPRSVINYDPTVAIESSNSYILIAKGSWNEAGAMEFGWPKNPVSAERVWRFDLSTNTVQEFSRDYDPGSDTWDWGLIEVKHE